jgi:nicotinamide N-methyltransferase
VLVFYTHHRPHLAQRDIEFFKIAGEMGWECEKVLTERFPVRVSVFRSGVSPLPHIILLIVIYQPMFPEDSGEEEVRSTVHGWKLARV